MADKTIPGLTDGGAVQAGDKVHVFRDPNSRRATLGNSASRDVGTTAGTVATGDDSRITGAVPSSRTITSGTGLSGGGDLSANRTLAVTYGTTAGTAAQGNDARIPPAGSTNDRILGWVAGAYAWTQLTIGMIADGLLTYAKLASAAIATSSEILAGTASKLLSAAAAESAMAWQTLTDGTTITPNHNSGRRFTVTTSTARTFSASNLKDGHPFILVCTGNHVHTWSATFYDFTEAGGVPTSVFAVTKYAGTVRNGKVRVYSVVETAA